MKNDSVAKFNERVSVVNELRVLLAEAKKKYLTGDKKAKDEVATLKYAIEFLKKPSKSHKAVELKISI